MRIYMIRHVILSCLFCVMSAALYAQTAEDTAAAQEETAEQTETASSPIQIPAISGFYWDYNYYSPPFFIRLGYSYRNRDFFIFPHVGIKSDFVSDGYTVMNIEALSGVQLTYSFFTWRPTFHVELAPLPSAQNQVYYGSNLFSFAVPFGVIGLTTEFGRRRIWDAGGETLYEPRLTQGVSLGIALVDTGVVKSDLNVGVSLSYLPYGDFLYYQPSLDIPTTISLYWVDLAARVNLFYVSPLAVKDHTPVKDYTISRPFSSQTGRYVLPFQKEDRYILTNHYELEARWYFLRYVLPEFGLFLSGFGNVGVGLDKNMNAHLLWQAGGGIGCTMLDTLPFTLQVGVNQDLKPIIFLNVVAYLAHRP